MASLIEQKSEFFFIAMTLPDFLTPSRLKITCRFISEFSLRYRATESGKHLPPVWERLGGGGG